MSHEDSETHDVAYLKQDNGELQEDVVAKDRRGVDRSATDPEVDEEVTESFPASDPPSYWSGGDDPATGGAGDRVVGRTPVPEVPEREHPADPVPKTLPRDHDEG